MKLPSLKFRLSTLLLVLTTIAVLLAWMCDRYRLVQENRQLNAECAELFRNQTEILTVDDWPINRTMRQPPKWTFYDPTDPADRKNYREGQPSKLMGGAR